MEKRFLRVKEAAALLSLSVQGLYDALLTGKIPGAKLAGLGWRVDIKAVNEMIERQIVERKCQR